MNEWALVGAGGFLGAVGRHLLGGAAQRAAGVAFPLGTLAVNVAGCAAIGLVMGWFDRRGGPPAEARAFLVAGLLGGFTTFSAFGFDTLALLRAERWLAGCANVLLQVTLGVAASALGFAAGRGS